MAVQGWALGFGPVGGGPVGGLGGLLEVVVNADLFAEVTASVVVATSPSTERLLLLEAIREAHSEFFLSTQGVLVAHTEALGYPTFVVEGNSELTALRVTPVTLHAEFGGEGLGVLVGHAEVWFDSERGILLVAGPELRPLLQSEALNVGPLVGGDGEVNLFLTANALQLTPQPD